VGKREVEKREAALRRLGSQAQEVLALDKAVATLAREAASPDAARAGAAAEKSSATA